MKGGKIAADTSFILSLLIERAQTPRAVEALRWAQEQYHEIYLPRQMIAEVVCMYWRASINIPATGEGFLGGR